MKLNKPPVIQTWIGFTFAPPALEPPWELLQASEFLSRFDSLLPVREAILQTEYEIQDISPAHQPKIVNREFQLDNVKARNQDGTHWLQIAKGRLVYNRTRGEGVYLGFESLRDEALSKLSDYVEFFRPSSLLTAELHYVDLIEIPIPPDRSLDLEQYFKLRVEIPPVYGPTWYFSTRLFLRPPIEGDILEVKFTSEPPVPEANTYRFRIDWHMACSGIKVFYQEVVRERLDKAHDCLTTYFKASVTERTWALFQPSDEGDHAVRSSNRSPAGPA